MPENLRNSDSRSRNTSDLAKPSPDTHATSRYIGLGDILYAVFDPVAKLIDSMAGTNIAGCTPCRKRRKRLNRLVRVKQRPYLGGNF